jgi:hypothetical protein
MLQAIADTCGLGRGLQGRRLLAQAPFGHQGDSPTKPPAPAPQASLAVPPEQAQRFKALWSARREPARAEEVSELMSAGFEAASFLRYHEVALTERTARRVPRFGLAGLGVPRGGK